MNRREALRTFAGVVSATVLGPSQWLHSADAPPKTTLGIADFSYNLRLADERTRRVTPGLSDPITLLEHCHALGAGGVQMPVRLTDELATTVLRRRAESHGMFIEASVRLPQDAADADRFDADIRTARAVGATVARTIMLSGRRYENFETAEQFRQFTEKSWKSLQLAAPIVEKHRIRLAVENHKDFRAHEQVALLKKLGNEYVGACVDFGNNVALLDDPMQLIETLAPYAFSAHIKDHAVQEYPDGFLSADVCLGDGFFDLPRMIQTLRRARPDIHFCLEMATRDPLKVPCLTDKYWVTFPDAPASDLARILRLVREKRSDRMPQVSHLSRAQQIDLEEQNIKTCLAFARSRLSL